MTKQAPGVKSHRAGWALEALNGPFTAMIDLGGFYDEVVEVMAASSFHKRLLFLLPTNVTYLLITFKVLRNH